MAKDKAKENETDDESTTTVTDDESTTETEEDFVSFLKKHSLSGDKVLGILSEFGVNSLYDLKTTKEDSEILGQVKEKLKGYPIVIKALDALTVEAIDNAIFYSENPGAEAKGKALADFLASNDVLADGKGWDKLLSILRSGGVNSLDGLKAIKEKGPTDAKLKALTAKIKTWNQEAASSFESITAAMVALALRGGAPEATPELKAFIAKKSFRLAPRKNWSNLASRLWTSSRRLKKTQPRAAAWISLKQNSPTRESGGRPSSLTI